MMVWIADIFVVTKGCPDQRQVVIKHKSAGNMKQRSTDDDPFKSLYFDGWSVGLKFKKSLEKNICLLDVERISQYVGHVISSDGSTHDKTTVIFEYITGH